VEAGLRAIDAARKDGSATQFGRAVAVVVEPVYGVIAFPARISTLFDEARSVLGDGDRALRARLLAFEAFKYATHTLHGRESRVLAEAAVVIARQTADAMTLADALYAQAVSLEGAPDLTQRMALGEELVDLGRSAGARATAFGLRVLAGVHLERGDATALDSTIDELGRVGAHQRWVPAHAYTTQYRVTRALLEGDFDEVRSQGAALNRYARAYHGASGMHFMQSIYLAREQGDLRGQGLALRIAPDPTYDLYTWATLALAQLDAGEESAARRTLDRVIADGLRQRETETGFGSALGMLAEVTASVGTPTHAAALYDPLTPFAGQLLTVVLGLACIGAADRYLGMLSTVLGRWDEGASHFERAAAIEERARGHALLPRSRYWQARLLRARGQADDARAAARILASVIADASRLGMLGLRAQAEALRAR
jgi:tetratricopeptide (TPR) repeat protein